MAWPDKEVDAIRDDNNRLRSEIMWYRSTLVSILTLCASSTPPTYTQIAEVAQSALEKH